MRSRWCSGPRFGERSSGFTPADRPRSSSRELALPERHVHRLRVAVEQRIERGGQRVEPALEAVETFVVCAIHASEYRERDGGGQTRRHTCTRARVRGDNCTSRCSRSTSVFAREHDASTSLAYKEEVGGSRPSTPTAASLVGGPDVQVACSCGSVVNSKSAALAARAGRP